MKVCGKSMLSRGNSRCEGPETAAWGDGFEKEQEKVPGMAGTERPWGEKWGMRSGVRRHSGPGGCGLPTSLRISAEEQGGLNLYF